METISRTAPTSLESLSLCNANYLQKLQIGQRLCEWLVNGNKLGSPCQRRV